MKRRQLRTEVGQRTNCVRGRSMPLLLFSLLSSRFPCRVSPHLTHAVSRRRLPTLTLANDGRRQEGVPDRLEHRGVQVSGGDSSDRRRGDGSPNPRPGTAQHLGASSHKRNALNYQSCANGFAGMFWVSPCDVGAPLHTFGAGPLFLMLVTKSISSTDVRVRDRIQ